MSQKRHMLPLFSGLTLFLAFAVHRRSWRGPRPTWLCGSFSGQTKPGSQSLTHMFAHLFGAPLWGLFAHLLGGVVRPPLGGLFVARPPLGGGWVAHLLGGCSPTSSRGGCSPTTPRGRHWFRWLVVVVVVGVGFKPAGGSEPRGRRGVNMTPFLVGDEYDITDFRWWWWWWWWGLVSNQPGAQSPGVGVA